MLAQAPFFQNLSINKTTGGTLALGKTSEASVQGMGNQFKSLMKSLMTKVDTGDSMDMDSLMSLMNLDGAPGKKSSDLLALLSGKIKSSGTIPSGRFVDEDGLADLEQMLVALGFNQETVSGFIRNLKQGTDKGDVALSSLMSKLGNFVQENDTEDELELSALPYIESLLNSFGIDPRQVEKLIKKAGQSGSGIDLDSLVADLKQLQASHDEPVIGATSGQDNRIRGLGLDSKKNTGTLSLDEFVTRLETLIREKNPSRSSAGTLESLSQSFADNVRNSTKPKRSDDGSFQSEAGIRKTDSSSLSFESAQVKSPQPMSRNASESAFFSGAKAENVKTHVKEVIKDASSSFEKNLKESMRISKDGGDTPEYTAKTLTGPDIYGKVSDMKAAASTEKTLPAYVTDQVARQISKAVKLGDSEITFSIRPPEMGRVQLSIENTREGMKISIVTEQHATRDMILSHTADLKTMLSDQGIRLDKLDVDVSGNFGQSMAQARQDAENSGKDRKNRGKDSFSLGRVADERTEDTVVRSWRRTRGNLDLVA